MLSASFPLTQQDTNKTALKQPSYLIFGGERAIHLMVIIHLTEVTNEEKRITEEN